MKKPVSNSLRYFIAAFLFLTAFLERTVWDLGPNFELITTVMILSSLYLGRKSTFWLVFAIVALTDRFIGNSRIFLFTWSGFMIPALFSSKLIKALLTKKNLRTISLVSAGVGSNLFFYVWTNFGVWLLDSWGMYEKSLPGLIKCYIYALPFLKNQVISSLIFIPLGYFAIELVLHISKRYNLSGRFLQIGKNAQ